MTQWFSHSGDLGDIIYSLPTIRACGGGSLRLFDMPGRTAHGMTESKVNRLKPLLEAQDYIDQVVWSPHGPDHNLNGFRDHWRHGNLADMHLATHGLDWEHRKKNWLTVSPLESPYKVLAHRSARYQNVRFPWRKITELYAGNIGFVGLKNEYAEFCENVSEIPFVDAPDFLVLARLIAGSELYIGNSSSPLAVAHGLKHPTIMEITSGGEQHLAVFQRMDCIIGWDEKVELPELKAA